MKSNTKVFISPSRYMQGTDILENLPEHVCPLGKNLLILASGGSIRRLEQVFEMMKEQEGISVHVESFTGECTMKEIKRVCGVCEVLGIDVIAGIGGGKVIDTAKAVSHYKNLGLVIVPTTASSDAPCSALSIIYKEDGGLDQLLWLQANPDIVLLDLGVIVRAPARLFAAGIGDALATYFEMKECFAKDADNFCGGRITLAARAIARQCFDTIMENGAEAYRAVEKHCITRAFEDVVEANTLLSGIGFESGGICAAHPINNGLAELPQTHKMLHGEKVAFALICQMILAKEPKDTVDAVLDLLVKVGLPVTLKELGIDSILEEELELIAGTAFGDPCIRNLPLRVDKTYIKGAVIYADELGRRYKESCGN